MKEYALSNGEVVQIKPLTNAVVEAASRQLLKDGIVVRGVQETALHDNVHLNAELVRQVLVSWKTEDGTEKIRNLRPQKARELIMDSPGIEVVLEDARSQAEEIAKSRKLDLVN